jgi:hypothetical protein
MLLCINLGISGMPKTNKEVVPSSRIEKSVKQPGHYKITHTETIEEEYSQQEKAIKKKKNKAKIAGKVILAIFTFGLSLIGGSCS